MDNSSNLTLCQLIERDQAYLESSQRWSKDQSVAAIIRDRFTKEGRVYVKRDGVWQFEGSRETKILA